MKFNSQFMGSGRLCPSLVSALTPDAFPFWVSTESSGLLQGHRLEVECTIKSELS